MLCTTTVNYAYNDPPKQTTIKRRSVYFMGACIPVVVLNKGVPYQDRCHKKLHNHHPTLASINLMLEVLVILNIKLTVFRFG